MTSRNPNYSPDASSEMIVNDVFLSPRVIDKRAYSELAGEIRELLNQTVAERSALTAALDQAGRADQDFRQREAAQAVNLDLCAKALKKIDEKTARVEGLLARVDEAGSRIAQFEEQSQTIVNVKLDALEARVNAIQAAAAAKTEALEERLRSASREIEQRIDAIRRDADVIVAPTTEHLNALCARAAALAGSEPGQFGPVTPTPGSLADLIGRAESLSRIAEETIGQLDESRRRAGQDRSVYDAWLARMQSDLEGLERRRIEIGGATTELTEQAERTLSMLKARVAEQEELARARSGEIRTDARRDLDELAQEAERALVSVRARMTEQEEQCRARVQELRDDAQRTVGELRQQAEQTSSAVLARLGQQEELVTSRAAAVRDDARRTFDDLRQRAEDAASSLGARLSEQEQSAMSRAITARDDARRAIDDLESRLESAKGEASAALLEIKPRTEALMGELRSTIRQAEDAHNTTGLALRLLEKAAAQAGSTAEQLKPWAAMLDSSGGEQSIPAPIRRIIESVRSGMQADLSRIASALREAAGRAETFGTQIDEPAVTVRQPNARAQSAD